MILCVCKNVSDKQIKAAINSGSKDLKSIQEKTGACTDCKICYSDLKELIEKNTNETIQNRDRETICI